MTLTEFLAARLDEDEAAATAATPGPWRTGRTHTLDYGPFSDLEPGAVGFADGQTYPRPVVLEGSHVCADRAQVAWMDDGSDWVGNASHIARHDPARVLRDVEAKRAILALHEPNGGYCSTCLESESDLYGAEYEEAPCLNVRHLAAVYSDHPDYDPEWSPT